MCMVVSKENIKKKMFSTFCLSIYSIKVWDILCVSDAVFLRIRPNRQQHFSYHPISFQCEGGDGSSQLRGVRSSEEINPACQNKRTSTGFVCTISNIYVADSGEYWCETKGGQRSNSVNITVTGRFIVFLKSL